MRSTNIFEKKNFQNTLHTPVFSIPQYYLRSHIHLQEI